MYGYIGTRSWSCPDCGAVLHLPFAWGRCRQPAQLIYWRGRMVSDHAHAMPLLHPTLLPRHHAASRT